jgi:hypothetical protein
MFEREFEIIVPQSFEVCLERIDTLKMPGCLLRFFKPIDTFVYPRDKDAQFVLRQMLGGNAGYAVIKGIVEPLDDGNTRISGIAKLEGVVFILALFTLVALAFVIQDIASRNWLLIGFTCIWYPIAMYQQIYFRNRLINVLETVLRQ